MNRFHEFRPGEPPPAVPRVFPSPFAANPHPLALRAASDLQCWLRQHYPGLESAEGKMFGVLVVKTASGRMGYFAGFSGMLGERWILPGFVPPVFDVAARGAFLDAGEKRLAALTAKIEALRSTPEIFRTEKALTQARETAHQAVSSLRGQHLERRKTRRQQRVLLAGLDDINERERQLAVLARQSQADKRQKKALRQDWERKIADLAARLALLTDDIALLEQERKALSRSLQQRVFDGYLLRNRIGEQQPLSAFFDEALIPGGAGDCAGAKLIHHAVGQAAKPLAMAEFWWGQPAAAGVRHHGQFYPACRGKCRPILPFMLRGIELNPEPKPFLIEQDTCLDVVYQDAALMLINKPAGLLSVPGKEVSDSVQTRLRHIVADGIRPLLVHRLDLGTSGLLLVALQPQAHRALQQQFMRRTVEKRYVALLDGGPANGEGLIDLPLRVDLDDRPRQLVCRRHGKKALTRWRVVSREAGRTRIHFYPLTGRTHQLRLHAAHCEGLNAPIVGDVLYGRTKARRMMLHAEKLRFVHPESGKWLAFSVPPPF